MNTLKLRQIIFSSAFLLLLAMPAVKMWLDPIAFNEAVEKRRAYPMPSVPVSMADLESFPGAVEAALNDIFGFRQILIWIHNSLKYSIGISPTSSVVMGKDNFLFFADEGVIDDYRNTHPFTDEELNQLERVLTGRQLWYEQQGIRYFFMVAPNKHTIYSDLLPASINKINGQSRFDQLISRMKERSTVSIIDVRPALLAMKEQSIVYNRTDTHWNDLGAYQAYAQLISELFAGTDWGSAWELDEFTQTTESVSGFGLARLLGVGDLILEEKLLLIPKPKRRATIKVEAFPPQLDWQSKKDKLMVARHENTDLPTMVMFRDSFSMALIPFLKEHFSQSAYIWKPHKHDVARYVFDTYGKPDFVVEEVVERYLSRPLIGHAQETSARLSNHFQQSAEVVFKAEMLEPSTEIIALHHAKLSFANPGIRVETSDANPVLHLPGIDFPQNTRIAIHIQIEAPEETILQLYYLDREMQSHANTHIRQVRLSRGINDVYIDLDRAGLVSPLRLDPGMIPGDYLIREIEIRTISTD